MNIELSVEDQRWDENSIAKIIEESAESVFAELKLKHDDVEIDFLCADDQEIRCLNKTYRGIDKPTNVLSFPAESYDDYEDEHDDDCECSCGHDCHCGECDCSDDEDCPPCLLGSVALAYETIEREAAEQDKTFENHLRHLVVHSVLHLLGYDHIEHKDAAKMEELEIRILKKMNISDPYQ